MRTLRSEKGMTLIELITVTVVLSILAGMMISTFKAYRGTAAHFVALQTLRDSRVALQAALIEPEDHTTFLGLTTQAIQGPFQNPVANSLLPGFQIPKNTQVSIYFDPECDSVGCTSELLQVNHCIGQRLALWERYGDGSEVMLDSLVSPGCV